VSKLYDKHNNPFRLNHPKRGDYEVLYDAFFKMQERLVAAESSLEEARDGYNKQVRSLHDRSIKAEDRLEEATELVAEAGDVFDHLGQGLFYAVGPHLCQPYKNFILKNLKI